ncbi:hypothetical protein F511_22065 [Dorcoceras hygrometricum]|uniref:Uncharacterized protein n=1 Tax=Dorcoceras hygrometricum TaxID=472368 RepID=A0A2Z7CAM7_9LAMI|nr:hypothetical protein F511_22065 [Dorcoceras hygrometricum]
MINVNSEDLFCFKVLFHFVTTDFISAVRQLRSEQEVKTDSSCWVLCLSMASVFRVIADVVFLPQIDISDKGKAPLVEKDDIKGHPAREMFSLICADIDCIVQLREKVVADVVSLFHSFSLSRLAVLGSVKAIVAKEEQILSWAETDSLETAVQRRMYIISKCREMLLIKFLEAHRENFISGQPWTAMALQIINMLTNTHQTSLAQLQKQKRAHNMEWTRPISSRLFEGEHVDRGAIIARSNKNTRSVCWSRHMIKIYGLWTPIEGPDRWYCMCRPSCFYKELVSHEVSVSNFAPICVFLEPVQSQIFSPPLVKTWGWFRVCTDILPLNLFGRLQPVGSHNFCRDIVAVSSVVDLAVDPADFIGHFLRLWLLRVFQMLLLSIISDENQTDLSI